MCVQTRKMKEINRSSIMVVKCPIRLDDVIRTKDLWFGLLGIAWWFCLWGDLSFCVEWMQLKTGEWLILTTGLKIRFIPSAFSPVTVTPTNYHSAHNIHCHIIQNGHHCQYYYYTIVRTIYSRMWPLNCVIHTLIVWDILI